MKNRLVAVLVAASFAGVLLAGAGAHAAGGGGGVSDPLGLGKRPHPTVQAGPFNPVMFVGSLVLFTWAGFAFASGVGIPAGVLASAAGIYFLDCSTGACDPQPLPRGKTPPRRTTRLAQFSLPTGNQTARDASAKVRALAQRTGDTVQGILGTGGLPSGLGQHR